jgi:hypothetical protein
MKKMFRFTSLLLFLGLSSNLGRASMTLQSLAGAVTSTEVVSLKNFMSGESPPSGQTYDNTIADGTAGMEAEALGLVYEVTNDPALLNQMIVYADQFLALRNNTNNGQIMWDGNRDPVWLTKPLTNSDGSVDSQVGYAGCENNDIVGHIAYCAKLILETPSLWNTVVPGGDPHTNGATYFQRAQTYIAQMDDTQDAYMLKWFINPDNFQIVAPSSAAWTAEDENVNAWNRQMMFLNGFQRLSECHQLLGDNPARVTKYDAIVRAAMAVFIGALQPYTTNGAAVYNWTYAPGSGGSEDNTLHSTYDLWGITRAWASGRYGLANATMLPFANTLQYVMNVSTNHISYYVNGSSTGESTRDFIYPGWMPVANFNAATYSIMANMNIAQGSQASTAIFDAFILWVKNARYRGLYPTNNNAADFTISTPWLQMISSGSNATCLVTLNPLSGFTNTVTFSAGHLPKGITAAFSAPAITNGTGAVTLTLTASDTTPGGIYALTNGTVISGTSNLGVRTAPLALVVKPHPVIMNFGLTGNNFILHGTNGFWNATFYLLSGTNLASPPSEWTPLATNSFGTNGDFTVTNQINGTSGRFYLIQY